MRLRIFSSPTCVGLRYGSPACSPRDFSWERGINHFALTRSPSALGDDCPAFDSYEAHLRLWTGTSTPRLAYPSPSSLGSTQTRLRRNINLLPITYAFRPRLRIRLTLGRLT